jgi:hypothetical protein
LNYECVAIYRNKKTNKILVQPMARHPTGASADFGAPTELAESDWDSRLLSTVLEDLAKYGGQQYEADLAPKYQRTEYARFTRSNDLVSITRLKNGVVEVNPSERVRGGYRGLNDQMIVLSPEEAPTRLVTAIREALALCT